MRATGRWTASRAVPAATPCEWIAATASAAASGDGGENLAAGRVQPLAHRRVMREVLARLELVAELAEQPEALGDDVVLVDRLEVLLARGDERRVLERAVLGDDPGDHLAHAVLDEPRAAVRLLDDRALVRALHQLVDLARHRVLDDRQQGRRLDLVRAVLRAADV